MAIDNTKRGYSSDSPLTYSDLKAATRNLDLCIHTPDIAKARNWRITLIDVFQSSIMKELLS